MRTGLLLLCGCIAAAAITSTAVPQEDAPVADLPFAGPSPPQELNVFAPLIGQWDVTLEWRPSLQQKEGRTAKGQAVGQWLHNRHFIRVESTTASRQYRGESTTLYTYDSRRGVYRQWLFASDGLASESEGQWDEDERTMHWKPVNAAPNVMGTITERIAGDRFESAVIFKRDDGQVLTDVTLTATRNE